MAAPLIAVDFFEAGAGLPGTGKLHRYGPGIAPKGERALNNKTGPMQGGLHRTE
jgi:hypothetical protein